MNKFFTATCLFFLLFSCSKVVSQQHPNILWIDADDLGLELGCYGNVDVKTPNINKLAKEGTLYKNCYAVSPVCSPSRSSLMTGMYPTVINSLEHRTIDKKELPKGIEPITEYFRAAGYFCTNGNVDDMSKAGKGDFNFKGDHLFDGTDWNQRAEGQPFFAQVQIHEPHRWFEDDTLNPIDYRTVHLPDCYPDYPLLKADWAKYLESVQICDRKVGQIMDRLQQEGLLDNTIVILYGDHGRPHLRDKQFLYEGGLRTPLIIRWPHGLHANKIDNQLISLIDVSATSLALAHAEVPDYLNGNVFIGDHTAPRDYIFGFKQRMGDANDDSRSICDGRYKLIWNRMPEVPWMQMSGYKKMQYPAYALYYYLYERGELGAPYNQFMAAEKPEIEFYDLEKDPMEFNNLARDSAYNNIQNDLFKVLKDSLAIYEKNWKPEPTDVIDQAKAASARYFENGMKKMGLSASATNQEIVEWWERRLLNSESE